MQLVQTGGSLSTDEMIDRKMHVVNMKIGNIIGAPKQQLSR